MIGEPERDLAALVVLRVGRLVSTGDRYEPFRLIDADGAVAEPVTAYFRDLLAAGRSEATVRSYAHDLLRAIVLNGARVGRHSIIAAGTVLAEGQQVPEGALVAGVPGKVRREVSEEERAVIERNAATYVGLSRLHRRSEA